MDPIINSLIPAFSLQAYHQGMFKTITNKDLLGKWALLFFYPADFSFSSLAELEGIIKKYEKLRSIHVEVYAVSTDSHFVHKAWHDASEEVHQIKFPMLADPVGEFCQTMGVLEDDKGMASSGSFVANPDGVIKIAEVYSNGVLRSADELIRKIEAAQFVAQNPNEVCPAKWKQQGPTIKPSIDLVGKI